MHDCSATLVGEELTIGNGLIRRVWAYNSGALVSRSLTDVQRDVTWTFGGDEPDLLLPGEGDAASVSFESAWVADDPVRPAHLRAVVSHERGALRVEQVFCVFAGVAAVEMQLYLSGRSEATTWLGEAEAAGAAQNVEAQRLLSGRGIEAPRMDRLDLGGRHVRVDAVQFYDITDLRNTLVQTRSLLPYRRPAPLRGNVLFVRSTLSDAGVFMLKQSPCSDVQLADAGCDFAVSTSRVEVVGIGAEPGDLLPDELTRCYGCVVGVGPSDPARLNDALRRYQHTLRTYEVKRDFQIMVNTWGDRSQDAKLGEAFALQELDACQRLGATHFMLDDGWQLGRSSNSALGGGSLEGIWVRGDYWQVNPQKFPRGLAPLVERARQHGIQLSLWYAPSREDDYGTWRQDTEQLLALWRKHGVTTFKIDMVDIANKSCERNLRAMFEAVQRESRGAVTFCLDATAKRRYGYHWFREFGNVFVENRYTDWSNYYPYWTLRNLWMLSRYVPPQSLQFEFLNRWRNAEKYATDDPLAPANVPFEYCFAITMVAQPLGWFEASNLPAAAFDIAALVQTCREHAATWHGGRIYPIGAEPDGTTWTGFQSVADDGGGMLLMYRESNDAAEATLRPVLPIGHRGGCDVVAGDGEVKVVDGAIHAALPRPHSFVWVRYG